MDRSVIVRLLPAVFAQVEETSEVFDGLLQVMQDLHVPPEEVIAHEDRYFRFTPVPDHYLPALASWLDLGWLFTGEQRAGRETYGPGTLQLRRLIEQARELSSWRGTATGLSRFLQVATGIEGYEVISSTERSFHLVVYAPHDAREFASLVERIVREQKPVCSTHQVEFEPLPATIDETGDTDVG